MVGISGFGEATGTLKTLNSKIKFSSHVFMDGFKELVQHKETMPLLCIRIN